VRPWRARSAGGAWTRGARCRTTGPCACRAPRASPAPRACRAGSAPATAAPSARQLRARPWAPCCWACSCAASCSCSRPSWRASPRPPRWRLLRSLLISLLQFLALALQLRLPWPPTLLRAFAWLAALTNGAELAAPECLSSSWSFHLYAQALLAVLAAVFLAAALLHEAARLRLRCIGLREHSDNAARLAHLHALWQRRSALVSLSVIVACFSYIYLLNVLLEAWDCVATPDGALLLRSDTNITCTSAAHARFRRLAASVLLIAGVGVPAALALWLRHLQRAALVQPQALRPAWRGLADPATRTVWGTLYEMYCFGERDADAQQHAAGLHPLAQLRLALAAALAPCYEALLFLQKACLVLAAHVIRAPTAQAATQLAIYAASAALLCVVWPYKRVALRIPLAGAAAFLHVPDVLNWTALGVNLVPLLNLLATLAAGGRGAPTLDVFLVGLDVAAIALLVAAWLACVLAWRQHTRALEALHAPRSRGKLSAAVSCSVLSEAAALMALQLAGATTAPSVKMQLLSAARWLTTPRQRRNSSVAPAPSAADDKALREVLVAGASALAGHGDARPHKHASDDALLAGAQRSELTPPGTGEGRRRVSRYTALVNEALRAGGEQQQSQQTSQVTPPSSPRPSARLSSFALISVARPSDTDDDSSAIEVTVHRLSHYKPADAADSLRGLACTTEDVAHIIPAAAAQVALLASAGEHAAGHALCGAVEEACCGALARLQQERAAALRADAPALAAAADADMADLEQLFREHGFEAWALADRVASHTTASEPQERSGLHVGFALVAVLALLLLLTFAVGFGAYD
jgi:hypothetical protein